MDNSTSITNFFVFSPMYIKSKTHQGMSKTQQKLGVVEELFTFWNLNDAEATLDELEEV